MLSTPATICSVPAELSSMRAAMGAFVPGTAEVTATGAATTSALKGNARFDLDVRSGRFARTFDVAVMGESDEVYDGAAVWAKDISGGVHAYNAWFPRARARTDAFIQRRAYLDPKSGATFACTGTRREGGRELIVIRVQPPGGIPAELGIDARSHLLATVTERLPITTSITHYGDYRDAGGVNLPFTIAEGTLLEPNDGFTFNVRRYELKQRSIDSDFTRPTEARNASITRHAHSTTIPLKVEARELLVWASINGHAPMPFILDSGGHAILTTGAAKKLGLRTSGNGESGGAGSGTIALQYTRVKSIRLGGAQLLDQPMLVIPYPYAFYERGRKEPLAGILGLEVFERFVTRIDYGSGRLTLVDPSRFVDRGSGIRMPIRFQDDMPMLDAAADGRRGMFGVDTGNAGSLILFGNFLNRTGLDKAYPAGSVIIGHGTGGTNRGRLQYLHAFTIGSRTFHSVPSNFTNMPQGAFSSWTEAGNIGYEILARFVPAFDYANGTLYLDDGPRTYAPPSNRCGLSFIKNEPAAFDVVAVRNGSPGAVAGIAPGDRIIAIDGKDATEFSRADLYDLTIRAGSTLTLRVQHAGRFKDLRLLLR